MRFCIYCGGEHSTMNQRINCRAIWTSDGGGWLFRRRGGVVIKYKNLHFPTED